MLPIIADFTAGLLVGWDLLISKHAANRYNGQLRNFLKPPSSIKQAFIAGIIFSILIMISIIAWGIHKDLKTVPIEEANFLWIPVFFAGSAIGIIIQWFVISAIFFFTKVQKTQEYLNEYIWYSTIVLGPLSFILLIKTIQFPYIMALSLGILYGIAILEISILLLAFLRWFLTSDPNSMEHPRVIARFGLLIFICSKVIQFVIELS